MIAKNGGVMYQIQTEGALVATMMLIQQMTLGTELQDYCHRQIKRKEMGRSTTSREKVTYYGLSKKTTFCTIFRRQGTKGLCAQTAEMYQSRLGDVLDARTVESKFTAGTIATMQRSYV